MKSEISKDARRLALALHQAYPGVGVGLSSAQQLLDLTDLEPERLVAAIDELEALGLVRVISAPKALRSIVGLGVREALHEYVEAG